MCCSYKNVRNLNKSLACCYIRLSRGHPATQKIGRVIAKKGITAAATCSNWQTFSKELNFSEFFNQSVFLGSWKLYLSHFVKCNRKPQLTEVLKLYLTDSFSDLVQCILTFCKLQAQALIDRNCEKKNDKIRFHRSELSQQGWAWWAQNRRLSLCSANFDMIDYTHGRPLSW